jgi:hypothetical protein
MINAVIGLIVASAPLTLNGERQMSVVHANQVAEFTFESRAPHDDPFNMVEVDAIFSAPNGRKLRIPAFWAGGSRWKVRYASPQLGTHRFRTECSDRSDAGLNGITGAVEVSSYSGRNPLYKHGPVKATQGARHFEYADGTPFFWLGDTWWMGLCRRLQWPAEFRQLTSDRVTKGFNVIQIVAGLYPDMGAFDPRGANEFGFPCTQDYGRIQPEYFDLADKRIAHLVDSGISPCIVGTWGYHLPWLGEERMKKHWRYVIARWGAYPVFWCIAGEANLPYYLEKGFPFDDRKQVAGWTKVARYVRQIDPFHRPTSIHPTGLGRLTARGAVDDERLLDFDMLQTGHGDKDSLAPTVDTVRSSYAASPTMPVLNSEVCYEGILDRCHADIQRLMFWSCILSGAAGHTYGANGIWQLNRKGEPYGNSPHGGTYGPFPWDDAMNLPGSAELGFAKKLLMTLPWTKLQPMPQVVKRSETSKGEGAEDKYLSPYCAGIPGQLWVIYLPRAGCVSVSGMNARLKYRAAWFDPVKGIKTKSSAALPTPDGNWISPKPPLLDQDFVLVVSR